MQTYFEVYSHREDIVGDADRLVRAAEGLVVLEYIGCSESSLIGEYVGITYHAKEIRLHLNNHVVVVASDMEAVGRAEIVIILYRFV